MFNCFLATASQITRFSAAISLSSKVSLGWAKTGNRPAKLKVRAMIVRIVVTLIVFT